MKVKRDGEIAFESVSWKKGKVTGVIELRGKDGRG